MLRGSRATGAGPRDGIDGIVLDGIVLDVLDKIVLDVLNLVE
jgi:hypothetical protein